jgi:hypothetical protein
VYSKFRVRQKRPINADDRVHGHIWREFDCCRRKLEIEVDPGREIAWLDVEIGRKDGSRSGQLGRVLPELGIRLGPILMSK